jgi:hypothetical protein
MGKAFKTITFRRCDFCNSSKLKELNIEVFDTYTRDEIKQVDLRNNICEDCGLIFRNPMPTPEALRRFYAESFILMTEHKEHESTLRYDPVKKSQFDFIQPLIRNSRGKVLEIGCYEGGFLSFFDNARWARFGVEPTPSSMESMSGRASSRTSISGRSSTMLWLPFMLLNTPTALLNSSGRSTGC